MASLFFLLGVLTSLNDVLVPHLKEVFSLGYTGASLIQVTFFSAYFVMALPSGHVLTKVGYQRGLAMSLVISSVGALLFLAAARLPSYHVFLVGLFLLATGFTLLQVSANPYVAALGPAQTASSRLTLTQAFNSLGTTIGPLAGSWLILSTPMSAPAGGEAAYRLQQAAAVRGPYMVLAGSLLALAVVVLLLRLPALPPGKSRWADVSTAWQAPRLRRGVGAIFFYVGAEVAIGSFLVSFLGEPHVLALPAVAAARYVSIYWGGAMVGRFLGTPLLARYQPSRVLLALAVIAAGLVAMAVLGRGALAAAALLAVGLCNSIMFPTIFSLAIEGLGAATAAGSGLLVSAIVGGAVVPLLVGVVADKSSVSIALALVPVSYTYIAWYGKTALRIGNVPVRNS